MSPLALPAGIGIVKKDGFPDPLQCRDSPMVYHPVSEIRREDFPKLRPLDDETDRTRGMVGAPFHLLMKPHQVLLQFHFKPKSVVGVPLLYRQRSYCRYRFSIDHSGGMRADSRLCCRRSLPNLYV